MSDQIDVEFVKQYYYPILQLNLLHEESDQNIINFVKQNQTIFKWVNYLMFIEQTKLDYKFYTVQYGIKFVESHAIYHYINHGQYAKNSTNLDDHIAKYVEPTDKITTPFDRTMLIVTHELSLTGGGLVAIELYNYYKTGGCNVTIMNLSNVKQFVSDDVLTINKCDLDQLPHYDYIIINTIARNVQDWCLKNIKHIDRFVLWLHEVSDQYYMYKMDQLNFKYIVIASYFAYETFTKFTQYTNQLLKILYLPNPKYISNVDNDDRHKIRQNMRNTYNIRSDATVFLNIGTICEHKNQLEIVKSVENHLLSELCDLNIVVIFVGNNKNLISKYIATSKNKTLLETYIKILPPISHQEAHSYYFMSDVYISSAKTEVYGKVIVEAMELQLPIIGYAGGSHIELIKHDYNGLQYKSKKELADNIKYFAMNRDKISQYGKHARWYYKKIVRSIQNFFNQFGAMLEICKNKQNFSIQPNLIIKTDKFNLLESSVWIWKNILYMSGGYYPSLKTNDNLYMINLDTYSITTACKIPIDCATTHVDPIVYKDSVFFVSGQVGKAYGIATNSFYVLDLKTNQFTKLKNLDFCKYDMRGFVNNNKLIMFSGTTNDRSTPNDEIYSCDINDDYKWSKLSNNFLGSVHSALIKCAEDKFCYIDGCKCHSCTSKQLDIFHMYIHDQTNCIIDMSFNIVEIKSQQFQTSHTHSSCFYNEKINAIVCVGGQLFYDDIYYGIQIYYIEHDMWLNLNVDKSLDYIFNKGCCCAIYENKLHVFGGQLKSKSKFSDVFAVFDIEQ